MESKYIIWFEIYGKKLRVSVNAGSAKDARDKVKQAIIFHKIERKPEQDVSELFNMFFGKFKE